MDFLRSQLARIQQQLGTLNASQKMLTFSLVALMVMTLDEARPLPAGRIRYAAPFGI